MEIHRFEKLWFLGALLLVVAFIATVTYGAVGLGIQMIDDDGGTVDTVDPTASDGFREPGVYPANESGHYDVYVVARRFAFQPGSAPTPIRVPANSTVTFHVASADVVHGFEVAGTNANTMVVPGHAAELTVEFDEPATYGIVCNEYCGGGHHDMAGTLEVVPQSEFNGTA